MKIKNTLLELNGEITSDKVALNTNIDTQDGIYFKKLIAKIEKSNTKTERINKLFESSQREDMKLESIWDELCKQGGLESVLGRFSLNSDELRHKYFRQVGECLKVNAQLIEEILPEANTGLLSKVQKIWESEARQLESLKMELTAEEYQALIDSINPKMVEELQIRSRSSSGLNK